LHVDDPYPNHIIVINNCIATKQGKKKKEKRLAKDNLDIWVLQAANFQYRQVHDVPVLTSRKNIQGDFVHYWRLTEITFECIISTGNGGYFHISFL